MKLIFTILLLIFLIGIFLKPIEDFVGVTNTPGLNLGRYYPHCPQGFTQDDGNCVQFCRGCKTGVCEHGECASI